MIRDTKISQVTTFFCKDCLFGEKIHKEFFFEIIDFFEFEFVIQYLDLVSIKDCQLLSVRDYQYSILHWMKDLKNLLSQID